MSKFGMNFATLLTQIDSVNTKKYDEDEDKKNFWRLTKDKDGIGSAIIRFLPNKETDDFPFVRVYNHSFKNPTNGRWYIERSLSTIGQQDYIGETNQELWNTGIEENKKIVGLRKRKLQYISNIVVIKDPANPENNGKVFKFAYGKTIFDKIVAAAKPEPIMNEEGEEETPDPINAFDPFEGAAFSLKQTIVDKWPNFDGSAFLKRKPLFDGDEAKINEVMESLYELKDEHAPSKFKSYDELKKKLLWVLGEESKSSSGKGKPAKTETEEQLDEMEQLVDKPKATTKPVTKVTKAPPVPTATDDDSDDDSFFKSLVED